MKYAVLTSVAVLMSVSSAAFSQSETSPANTPASTPPAAKATQSNKSAASAQQQIKADLQQAGFTNIRVVPDSFVVQAKDKSGNPVTMFLSSGSMTVFSEDASNDQNEQSADGGMFSGVRDTDDLSSQVVGLDVYNSANQKIGTIQNIAFDANNLKAYIVGVGGFMGMGEHDVAVQPSAIKVTHDAAAKKWHATTDITADQLKAAPDAMRANTQPTTAGTFTSIQPTDDLSSKIVGLDVRNSANQNIGKIKDVAFNAKGVKAYIVGVGGFLSLGERYVAVRPSALSLSYNGSDRKWHAEMDANADQLKSAPQYKYSSNAY